MTVVITQVVQIAILTLRIESNVILGAQPNIEGMEGMSYLKRNVRIAIGPVDKSLGKVHFIEVKCNEQVERYMLKIILRELESLSMLGNVTLWPGSEDVNS
jgi:hypothetical protein